MLFFLERERERAQHNSSPLSLDSDGTDFLLVGFNKRNVSSKHVAFKGTHFNKKKIKKKIWFRGDTDTLHFTGYDGMSLSTLCFLFVMSVDVLRKQISLTEDGILGDASTEMPLSSTCLHSPGKESRPQPLGLGRPAQETLSGDPSKGANNY